MPFCARGFEAYGAGGNLLLRYTGDSNSRSFVPFNGRLLAEYYCGGMIFDHPDEIGSATTATDCTGNLVNEKLYYPFGEFWTGYALPNLGMHQEFAQLPDYDPETDQYNTLARNYSPSGRWLSPDPIRVTSDRLYDPQQLNAYAYVRNNPLALSDPTGMILQLAGNPLEAMEEMEDICSIVEAGNCNRLSVNTQGVVSFDTSGLDLSKNEGANLINDLVQSKDVYGFSEGPTVDTAGGTVKVDELENLDNRPEHRFDYRKPPGKRPKELPPEGFDDIVAINRNPEGTIVSLTNLQVAQRWTLVFHELGYAYDSRSEQNKGECRGKLA